MEKRTQKMQCTQIDRRKRKRQMKYAIIRSLSIAMSIIFVIVNWGVYGYITRYSEAIGWIIGLSAFGWASYIDARIKMVPNRLLGIMLFAGFIPIITISSFHECIMLMVQNITAMAIAAGSIWLFGTIMSFILQKEALGAADIFPCVMVAGLTGSGAAGNILFLLTPYVMLFLIILSKLCSADRKRIKAAGIRNRTLPLFPALYIAVYMLYPITSWIPYKIL